MKAESSVKSGKKWSFKGWVHSFNSFTKKGKEMLKQKVVPLGGKMIKGFTVKALKVAQGALESAKLALTDGGVGNGEECGLASERTGGATPRRAKKKDFVAEGKRLLSAIEDLRKRERAVREETAKNTKMNAHGLSTPVVAQAPPVPQSGAVNKLMLHHPDRLIASPAFAKAPPSSSSSYHHSNHGPVGEEKSGGESTAPMPPAGGFQRKSLLFGAKDLQQVKLKGLLKVDTDPWAAEASRGRRVSFGSNNTRTISPRPSPKETEAVKQLSFSQAPAPVVASGFNANDLLGARQQLKKVPAMPSEMSAHSSSSSSGVTMSGLKRASSKLRPAAPRTMAVNPLKLNQPISLEEQLRQTLASKFARANAFDIQSESSNMDEDVDDAEWL